MSINLTNTTLFRTQALINNEWVGGVKDKTFSVVNPYDHKTIAEVADLGQKQTRQAIKAAEKAFVTWKALTASKRYKILKKWAALQLANVDDLATILTTEQGKPLAEAKGEIRYGASYVNWFAEEALRVYGDVIPGHMTNKRLLAIKQPIGVVGAITPWNFPSAMITRKVAPALAAGCTVVLKPAELTPLSALALAELALQAGFPPGVFNVVTGADPRPIGEELTSNPIVRKLSFTGSTAVGKLLLRQCADTVKRVSMELGGNAPFIVFEDADVDAAVRSAVASKYRNAGQTCVCTNRIFVQEKIVYTFTKKYVKAVQQLKMGNGLKAGITIGPMVEEAAVSSVESIVADAVEKGAELRTGGKRQGRKNSLVFQPTVLANANTKMRCYQEEIFGPISPIFSFKTEKQVIKLANDTPYGLAAYFFGKDSSKIWRVAEALDYGMVGINTGIMSTVMAPFGGVKESGMGREGSKYGMDDYLEIKYLCWEV